MADANNDHSPTYSNSVGFLFVFNLIVGTGALALPKAFQAAGYGLGILLMCFSCFTSYVTASFVIESMCIANAVKQWRTEGEVSRSENTEAVERNFRITSRIEVSEMARMFLGRTGLIFSYLALIIYLFGDLTIYSTTVPKCIMNIICSTVNSSIAKGDDLCQPSWPAFLVRDAVYRMVVCAFIMFVTPMVIIGVVRTKYLQISTSACRWTAFGLMIFLASFHLARDGPQIIPPLASLSGFAPVFGTTVYAFMCHHSLPGLITPMRRKSGLMLGLVFVYLLVVSFYLAISVSGSFAFRNVFDVYSLEFLNNAIGFRVPDIIIGYFLAFFPVFTLTTNFPIVATTLCNNLYVLLELIGDLSSNVSEERERLLNDDSIVDNVPIPVIRASHSASASVRWLILFFVLFIPMVISLSTDNVLLLSALTGSYPGVGVQFVIPCLLIIGARRYATEILEFNVPDSSSSPFKSFIWPWAIFIWSLFTVIMVTLNLCELR